jgi:predicted nucleic acid-binding protein
MMVFVDTSALFSLLAADDARHEQAAKIWGCLIEDRTQLLTSSYVLVESFALVQRRLGMPAVRVLDRDIVPMLEVVWIDADLHQQAAAANAMANQRDLSLVDCSSFVVMRERGLQTAFAFDHHFEDQGFVLLTA